MAYRFVELHEYVYEYRYNPEDAEMQWFEYYVEHIYDDSISLWSVDAIDGRMEVLTSDDLSIRGFVMPLPGDYRKKDMESTLITRHLGNKLACSKLNRIAPDSAFNFKWDEGCTPFEIKVTEYGKVGIWDERDWYYDTSDMCDVVLAIINKTAIIEEVVEYVPTREDRLLQIDESIQQHIWAIDDYKSRIKLSRRRIKELKKQREVVENEN